MLNQSHKENFIQLFESAKTYNFCGHERETFKELSAAYNAYDEERLLWFSQFGNGLKQILLNVYGYRRGLNFGFTEISFDQYGWLIKPVFLDLEEIYFGQQDKSKYGEYSSIKVGRGPNGSWTYGMDICFGTAGSCSGISVYNPTFSSRDSAISYAMSSLKQQMLEKASHLDTGNYNKKIILATIKDIDRFQNAKNQLSLF